MDDEKQRAQDGRVERLWRTLDTRDEGQLDVPGLKSGLRKINHRLYSVTRLGSITRLILASALQNADNFINDVLKAVDSNGDGRIQYNGQQDITLPISCEDLTDRDQEFRTFVEQTEKELLTLFNSIDRDHNGKLDKDELQQAFARAGLSVDQSNLDRFFSDVDKNHDGVISFDEWRSVTRNTSNSVNFYHDSSLSQRLSAVYTNSRSRS